MSSWPSFTLILTMLVLCNSCASTALLSQRGSYLRAYHSGSLEVAEENLNVIVKEEIPGEQYTQSKDASWILLDRATTRLALGKTKEAAADYKNAIESLDYYRQDLPAEQLAKVLFQDETGAYQAADFEQILARLYFALTLLHEGDESNAYALLRQAEEYQQEAQALYAKVPFTRHYRVPTNGLGKYLFALLLEKRGDVSNANILYNQAAQLIPVVNGTFEECKQKQEAVVLVMCHNGKAPYKISVTSPASVASAAALEFFLATQRIDPAWSTLTGIPVPALQNWPFSSPRPTTVCVDGNIHPLLPYYDVTLAAKRELDQKMPVIVARGVARLMARRCAVGYLGRQDQCLGAIADLTMLVVNSNTRADTRSWTTLPARIDLTRFNVEAGSHQVTIQVSNYPLQSVQQDYTVHLKPNDLCIIHVFNIHPGITQVLIPNRYLGESL